MKFSILNHCSVVDSWQFHLIIVLIFIFTVLKYSQAPPLCKRNRLQSNNYWFTLISHVKMHSNLMYVKFIYSEKTTKFCEISTLLLTGTTQDKSKVEISQNFLAFSENINFTMYYISMQTNLQLKIYDKILDILEQTHIASLELLGHARLHIYYLVM